jgi:hypothetical protein
MSAKSVWGVDHRDIKMRKILCRNNNIVNTLIVLFICENIHTKRRMQPKLPPQAML